MAGIYLILMSIMSITTTSMLLSGRRACCCCLSCSISYRNLIRSYELPAATPIPVATDAARPVPALIKIIPNRPPAAAPMAVLINASSTSSSIPVGNFQVVANDGDDDGDGDGAGTTGAAAAPPPVASTDAGDGDGA